MRYVPVSAGATLLPRSPRYIEPGFLRALSDALS
jgi:hypothetical protein